MEMISKGAEADIYRTDDTVLKERIVKSYRVKELDEKLRRSRTKREAKLISLARRAGVPTPFVYDVDLANTTLEMKYVKGKQIKKILDSMPSAKRTQLCKEIGRSVGKLHSANIVHGDLTTANMVLSEGRVYFIDFGLGGVSESIEDKGVDILVFKKALHSTHHKSWEECFESFIEGYSGYGKHEEVLQRLTIIERRGRYFTRSS